MPIRRFNAHATRRFQAEAVTPPPPGPLSRRGLLAAAACACGAFGAGRLPGGHIPTAAAATLPLHGRLDDAARAIEARMIEWRRDFHQHPELGNQETRTAGIVAAHLKRLGYAVREGVAVTGVVGTLRGGAGDGPVVALRADMDALPVAEEVQLPFASQAKAQWDGAEVPVMHACGHDCHTAILMAVAEVLAAQRAALRGTVMLVFQPAEENLPRGEIGGAKRMLAEGAFADPKPDAVLGLHVVSGVPAGSLAYRAGPAACQRRRVPHHRDRAADPWGAALVRGRSDRHRGADRHSIADYPEPPSGCRPALGADGRAVPRRHPQQHYPRPCRNERHAPHL